METRIMLKLNTEDPTNRVEFKDHIIQCINYFEEAIRLIDKDFSIDRILCDNDPLENSSLEDFIKYLSDYKNDIEKNIVWSDDDRGFCKPEVGANVRGDSYLYSKFIGSDDGGLRCYFEVNYPLDEVDEVLLEASNLADGLMYIEAYDSMDDKYSSYQDGEHDSGDYC